jgi:hypothetical protein
MLSAAPIVTFQASAEPEVEIMQAICIVLLGVMASYSRADDKFSAVSSTASETSSLATKEASSASSMPLNSSGHVATSHSSATSTSTANAKSTSLSAGADAGIAIGAIILLIAIAAGFYFFVLRMRRSRSKSLQDNSSLSDFTATKPQLDDTPERTDKRPTLSVHAVEAARTFNAPWRSETMAALMESRAPRRSGTMLDLMASRKPSREV